MKNQEETQEKEIIKCPYCAEEINKAAKKCKHCQEWLKDREKERKTPVADGAQKALYRENISNLVFFIYLIGGGLLGYYLMNAGIVEGYWIIAVTAILSVIIALCISYLSEVVLAFLGIIAAAIGGYFVWVQTSAIYGIIAIIVILIAITGTRVLRETFDAYQK